jgi:hypothetical protein
VTRRRAAIGAGVALAAALGIGLWLAFAGGSRHGPTRQAYLAEVSSVCRSYARRLERIPAPSEPAAYGNVISSVVQVLRVLRAQEAAS